MARGKVRTLALALVGLTATLLLAPMAALGWGAEGHRIIGLIAEQRLDSRSRAALQDLVGDQSLADISVWLDQERSRLRGAWPGSERWHYDDWPVCAVEPDVDAYCRDGHCASRAYARAHATLRDRHAPRAARLDALRVLVHVLEDVHQPLHAADHDDHGGNRVEVLVGRRTRPMPLHVAWDVEFVKRLVRHRSEAAYAEGLAAAYRGEAARFEAGDFAAWLSESHRIAREEVYGRLPGFACGRALDGPILLPEVYVERAEPVVADRLARAGFRLAAVLREAL